ncbi:MAG: cysteine--tRNA ligase [Candidatus Paceibacterota bacterium]|jgi:cysteinyl-tRNA synthetase
MFSFLFHKKQITPLFLYNTLTREKEIFKPIKRGRVGVYTCGPTVYGFPHLGNMRTYIFEDILKRVLFFNDYKVKHVMNITDVGHLTGDRDMGDDKIEKESKKEGKTAWEIADFYTKAFKEDLEQLNIVFPNIFCKATDNIKEQIGMIKTLEKKGFTYITKDGIYFDTSKVADYTKLSHQKLEDLKEGARVEVNPEKRNPTDFALWKFSPKDGVTDSTGSPQAKRQMEWPSPWGIGFPGWHIECSAMSVKYLGEHFDIHCGGVDFVNLHHTNELAQTEAATGKVPWVNIWMHGAFLNMVGGRKMAKSAGDLVTLKTEFVDKNINPLAYRFATLNVHYRKPMEWSDSIIESAKNGLQNLYSKFISLGDKNGTVNKEWSNRFAQVINDDLNMPQALAVLHEMLKSSIPSKDKRATALYFDKVLGLDFINVKKVESVNITLDEKTKSLVEKRDLARQNKDWATSDVLRVELESMGYIVKDTPDGTKIEQK